MKVFIAITFLTLVCIAATADAPDKKERISVLLNRINSWTGSVDDLKDEIKKHIANEPGTYTLAQVNQFLDQVCAGWTLKSWKCEDYRAYVIAQKQAAGKIKAE
ncbi:hypothetical protein PVAND_015077 [Polypedilum vanderplanki]|uniref:Uncharacterized protein n=1 Tax=Polypedilum vanderplanki TaxID=319348 RepID=A0A9J6BBW4_POLVA|nr:hypothetical protein PVAND_015077 [Polypedilum vanderplanki]